MEDETRIELDKHFDEIQNLLHGENDDRLDVAIDAVKECARQVSEHLDEMLD